jgi:hypothetical protein
MGSDHALVWRFVPNIFAGGSPNDGVWGNFGGPSHVVETAGLATFRADIADAGFGAKGNYVGSPGGWSG